MQQKFLLTAALLAASLSLAGCLGFGPDVPPIDEPIEEPAEEVTRNVSYEGVLDEAGISLYMEGSHKLLLDSGNSLFLEGDREQLDASIGQRVRVTGDVRPTVEAGGRIMTVNEISSLETASSSSEMSSSSSEESSSAAAPVASSSAAKSSSSFIASSAPRVSPDTDTSTQMGARTAAMAKVNMDPVNWTQKYCTGHVGFCIPVHKNWWYKSFGATTSSLWHVEISNEEILNLSDGPIVLTVHTGSASADGTVRTEGDFAVGQKSLASGRHIEVRAPLALRSAVEFIIANVTPYSDE